MPPEEGRVASFGHALRGLRMLLATQRNARIHAAATLAVCGIGLALGISRGEWCWLTVAMMAVWAAEATNTALERLCDAAVPVPDPLVRDAKDLAAGAVLVSAIGSVVIGLLVFGPRVLGWGA